MNLSLVVLTPGNSLGKVIGITGPEFLIGTADECHLRPATPDVLPVHCALLVQDGKAFIRDLNPTNKATINGVPVKGTWPLQNGDRLQVGPLEFFVGIEADPGGPAVPPSDRSLPTPGTELEDLAALLLCSDDQTNDPGRPTRRPGQSFAAPEETLPQSPGAEPSKYLRRPVSNAEGAKKALLEYARKLRGKKG